RINEAVRHNHSDAATMFPALNAWTLPADLPPAEQLTVAAQAGFAGIELVIAAEGPLRPDTPLSEFSALADRAAKLGISVVSLATGLFWEVNYAAEREATRQRARDLTLRMLDRAAALGAGAILVLPAVVGTADAARMAIGYADALYRSHAALSELRHEAEARCVTIAIENVWNRFLLSPVEAADLLDRVNSPHVGFYFDTGNVLACGYPQDWIMTLGGRIARVHMKDYDLTRPGPAGFCNLGEGSVDWPAVMAAFRAVGYDGPLTYEGPGEPLDICRRLRNIIAGRNVSATEESD
ncbi:MAG: sugar phosphate isomerase/epimerase, partial [Planctomycetes bacterium]|nr:sugar phosphate isomerase/epimerase [Planctomycetota bacterium]